MDKVHRKTRPLCVTVIGRVWIAAGVLTCLSVAAIFPIWLMVTFMSLDVRLGPPARALSLLFVALLLLITVTGAMGFAAGFGLLRCKAWARKVLVCLTLLCALSVAGFGAICLSLWLLFPEAPEVAGWGAIATGAVLAVCGPPLLILLLYLRGKKVKNAVSEPAADPRRVWRRLLLAGIAGILLAFGAPILYILTAGREIPPPDVSDLEIRRAAVAPEDNAFTYFERAREILDLNSGDRDILDDFRHGKEVDVESLREALAKNADTVELIRQGLAREYCLTPEFTGLDTSLDYITAWRRFAALLAAESRLQARDGDYEGAVESCALILRFGDMIMKESSERFAYYTGLDAVQRGLAEVMQLVRENRLSGRELDRLAAALAGMIPPHRGFDRAIRGEYEHFSVMIDEISSDGFPENLTGWYYPLPVNSMVRGGGASNSSFFLKPERTKKNLSLLVRAFSRESARSYSEIEIDLGERADGALSFCGSPVTADLLMRIWLPNALGWSLLTGYGDNHSFGRAFRRGLQIETKLAAARLILALNLYHRAEGEYPESLDMLVPEYIESIPRDPYDGAPMRYSPHFGVVYSVGR